MQGDRQIWKAGWLASVVRAATFSFTERETLPQNLGQRYSLGQEPELLLYRTSIWFPVFTRQFRMAYNSSSRKFNTLFWPLGHEVYTHT